MGEKKAVRNHSVEKAFSIIENMAKVHGSMRLQDIAASCGMPSSTTLRILNTLEQLGYVVQSIHDSQYRLSLKFSAISEAVVAQTDLHSIIHPYLIKLSAACQESSCLAIEQDKAAVYIDVVMGPDTIIRTMQYIGKRAPMHCTGVGKLMLTNLTKEQVDEYISLKGLERFTPHTITMSEQMHAELSNIVLNGYAVDDEECELGARCLAAPIRNYTGKVIAGISISGPTTRMTMKKFDEVKPIILEMARSISSSLGYIGEEDGAKTST